MRVLNNGIANNFGLVGKSLRRYLTTTALTATSLAAIASPALADNWTDHVATEGSISIDTTVPNTTNITQGTNFVKVQGDGDINAGWTVNVAQPSSSSKYVLYDIEGDATQIMGALNANGQIYIFDQNGVIFGENSQVNVGSIVTSTGNIADADIKADKLKFVNVGGEGKIINKGTITVADAGLAAFVAPGVENAGVINAKMGKVALASGDTVTLDLYGDNLVEIAVDGKLENALVKNSGTINAQGGTVALTAQAAKGAVDDVINMDGVIDVSSVTTKGGKIILGGGNSGVVKVSGKLKADGKSGGGDVKVTGQNVVVTDTAEVSASAADSGNGGNVLVYGRDYAIFGGRISARGGANGGNGGNAEVSAGETVGYYGVTDLSANAGQRGALVIDPRFLTISNASFGFDLAYALSFGFGGSININDKALADTLYYSDVNLWATEAINTVGNIDLSTAKVQTGTTYGSFFSGCFFGCPVYSNLITGKDLTLAAPTVNINRDVILGNGKLNLSDLPATASVLGFGIINVPAGGINVDTVNLNGTIKTRTSVGGLPSVVTDDAKINSTADTINVKSSDAKIQQAILFAQGNGTVVNVAKGTYAESVLIDKKIVLNGAKKDVTGHDASRGTDETVIDPSSPAIHITSGGSGTVINGVYLTGATNPNGYGLWVDNADNITFKNSVINGTDLEGIYAFGGDNLSILDNAVDNTGKDGIYIQNYTGDVEVLRNYIGYALGGNIKGDGVYARNVDGIRVNDNFIKGLQGGGNDNNTGVYLVQSDDSFVQGNEISNAAWDGVKISTSDDVNVSGNTISNTKREGIFGDLANRIIVLGNTIHDVINTNFAGVQLQRSFDVTVGGDGAGEENTIYNADYGVRVNRLFGTDNKIDHNVIYDIYTDGVHVTNNSQSVFITGNSINDTGKHGIYAQGGNNLSITGNIIDDTDNDGVYVDSYTGTVDISENYIGMYGTNIKGDGIYITKTNDATITKNHINGLQSGGSDNNSGVYAFKADRTYIFDNDITNAAWDGVKVAASEDNEVIGNRISFIKREGVYGDVANGIIVKGNTIHDMINTNFAGVQLKNSSNVTVGGFEEGERNEIYNADFGVRAEKLGGLNKIHNNLIHDIYTNGIKLWNAANNVFVQGNDIDDTGKEGIYAEKGTDLSITENHIDDTKADGVHIREYLGTVDVSDNFIGMDGTNIKGDGIYLTKTHSATITKNHINGLQGGGHDNNTGVYASQSNGTYIFDNDITNAAWDGVKVAASTGNRVIGNRISFIKREGVFGDVANNIIVKGNTIHDMINPDFAGVQLQRSKDVTVGGYGEDESNTIYNADYGVRVERLFNPNNKIQNNVIYDIYTDGINAGGSENIGLTIDGNDIDRTGAHGINLFDTTGDLSITDNFIDVTGKNGILVSEVNDILVQGNVIDLASWDGIHVHYFGNADILGNTISHSGDDGIEAHDGASVLIDGNEISQSGTGEFKLTGSVYDEFDGGYDGISVRRMKGEGDDEIIAPIYGKYVYGYTPASVSITNNQIVDAPEEAKVVTGGGISASGDDGIEVVDVDGYVYIYNNDVEKSGTDGEGSSYGQADWYGADGIHVRNVFANGDIYSAIWEGDVGNGEYNIVVANNRVSDSLDDGIEVLGAYSGDARTAKISEEDYEYDYYYGHTGRVLVKDNTVNNSGWGNPALGFGQAINGFGGDGIHVTNISPYYYGEVGAVEGGEYVGYAVDILHNTVNNSGDDGIEVTYSSSTLIDDNTVTNSGTTFEGGEGGTISTADEYGADGIHVRNVGYDTYEYPDYDYELSDKNSIFALEGEGYKAYSVVIVRNNVDNSQDDGIQVDNEMWQEWTAPVLVDSNENVSNSGNHGLYISGFNHGDVIVSNNAFSNFDIGAEFESGLIDLHGVGNTFTGGRVGLRFAPYMFEGEGEPSFAYLELYDDDAPGVDPYNPLVTPTNFGGTIGSQIFTGFLEEGDYYVELANGAFYNPGTPTWLNGLNSTYDTIQPSLTDGLLSEADFNFLEERFHHYPDGLISGENLGLFWFGFFETETAAINQKDLFNVFGAFNGDITGLNVRITGLPRLPGQAGGGTTTGQGLNNIETFAGGPGSNPSDLNNIETAAGGEDNTDPTQPNQLAEIETEAGGDSSNDSCWSSAMNSAAGGQVVNVVYGGSMSDNLNQAASCGTGF